MSGRITCFVDGLNVYYSIRRFKDLQPFNVSLRSLASKFIDPKSESLQSVYYFYATLQDKEEESHRHYVSQLVNEKVIPVEGYFTKVRVRCRGCKSENVGWVEKQSDVNLALGIFREAVEDRYDHAIVITDDADITPACRETLKLFPNKKITVLKMRKTSDEELVKLGVKCQKISKQHILDSLF